MTASPDKSAATELQLQDQPGRHSWRPGLTAANDTSVGLRPMLLSKVDSAAFLALSVSTFERLVARRKAPQPRQVSEGRVAWLVDELTTWARDLPASELLPPKNSGYGRAGKPARKA